MVLKLVIFDCDGVLVDSEPISNQLFVEALSQIGLVMTIEECVHTFVGRSTKTNIATVERMYGAPLPPNFISDLRARSEERFAQHLKPVRGIESALKQISLPVCVASGGQLETIRRNLSITGLMSIFGENIFSVTHVANGKPAPDIFLHAAKTMQVEPEHCAVVEDSIPGVQAGCAAGMKVLAYSGTFPEATLKEAGAHVVFDEMHELPGLLQI